tara:strand:+ start:9583 stop:10419 length:837 start_codon:yes stop_codon:yes gene_type:complete
MTSNYLVIGGTGKTGRKVVQTLQNLGQQVRIGSRKATPAFDWNKPENWDEMLSGIDKMYITYQPDLAVPGALEAIELLVRKAQQNNIQKVVLLSGKGEREAELCEQVVIHSGLDYTIVRASWFMQNFSESFFLDPILAGHVALPAPEAKVPYINTDDIAAVVTEALLHEKHNEKIYELTGPELLTFPEVISTIATAANRTIHFTPITQTEYVEAMQKMQVPEDYIWLINYLFTEVLQAEGNDKLSNDVEKVLGRKPKSFATYAQETAKTGIWNAVTTV